jgi:hypothetical protein
MQALPSTVSDPLGGFAFEGLPGGTWSVHARAPDGSEAIVNDVAAGSADLLVRLHRPSGIDATLVGYDAPPAAIYARLLSRKGGLIPGQMGNSTFHISLAAGVYIVSAMNATEGDVQRVEVAEGETTQVTMTSHGHARVVGTVVDYATGAPVPDLVWSTSQPRCSSARVTPSASTQWSWLPSTAKAGASKPPRSSEMSGSDLFEYVR